MKPTLSLFNRFLKGLRCPFSLTRYGSLALMRNHTKGKKMKLKQFLKILAKHDENNEVIFYNLKDNNLTEFKLETILDADERTEITTYAEGEINE
tara:strand:+ start:2154 stop:2438 length:285 start_codon:yes stop_codon:yes gene_type:complete